MAIRREHLGATRRQHLLASRSRRLPEVVHALGRATLVMLAVTSLSASLDLTRHTELDGIWAAALVWFPGCIAAIGVLCVQWLAASEFGNVGQARFSAERRHAARAVQIEEAILGGASVTYDTLDLRVRRAWAAPGRAPERWVLDTDEGVVSILGPLPLIALSGEAERRELPARLRLERLVHSGALLGARAHAGPKIPLQRLEAPLGVPTTNARSLDLRDPAQLDPALARATIGLHSGYRT